MKIAKEISNLIKKGKFNLRQHEYCDLRCDFCLSQKTCLLYFLKASKKIKTTRPLNNAVLPKELQVNRQVYLYIRELLANILQIQNHKENLNLLEKYKKEILVKLSQDYLKELYRFLNINPNRQLKLRKNSEKETLIWYGFVISSKILQAFREYEIKIDLNRANISSSHSSLEQIGIVIEKGVQKSQVALQNIFQKSKNKKNIIETIAFLLNQLNLINVTFKRKFFLPLRYNITLPKFTQKQEEIFKLFRKNPSQAFNNILNHFIKFPQDSMNSLIVGEFYVNLGNDYKATPFLEFSSILNPNDYFVQFIFGSTLAKIGRFNYAYKVLSRAMILDNQDPDVLRNLAWVLIMKGYFRNNEMDIEKGIDLLKGLLSRGIKDIFILLDLSQAYLMLGNFEEAFFWIEEARKKKPDHKVITNVSSIIKTLKENGNPTKIYQLKEDISFENIQEITIKLDTEEELDDYIEAYLKVRNFINYLNNKKKIDNNELRKMFVKFGGFGFDESILNSITYQKKQILVEYLNLRARFKYLEDKYKDIDVNFYINKFLSTNKVSVKKEIIITLAIQGEEDALLALKKLKKDCQGTLKFWLDLAIKECENNRTNKLLPCEFII